MKCRKNLVVKFFILFIIGVVCSFNSARSESAAMASTGDPSQEQAKIVIEYLHINSETFGGPTIEQYAKAFNSSHDKYIVKPVFVPDSYKGVMQQLQANAAAGKPSAVAQVGYYWLNYFSLTHQFVDINTLDPAYMNNYLPNVKALATTSDGRIAGVPYSFSTPVIYYNLTLLAEAGLDTSNLPKTVDELYDWARAVKDKTGKFGFIIAASGDFWLEQWEIESNGGRMIQVNGDGGIKATFASPEGIEALQRMSDLINKDKAAIYLLGDAGKDGFTSGNIAMFAATIGYCSGIRDTVNFDLATGPLPTYGEKTPRVPTGGNFLAITAQSAETQKGAWEWIKFLTTQEGYYEWTVGTGYVPPRKDVEELPLFQEYLKKNPLLNASLRQMPLTVPFVSFPGDAGLQIEQGLLDARDAIMNGEQSAEQVLTKLQNRANELMGQE
jgi:ABC-type glycerol-3-phosphate transport system substrate-binding protein